MSRTIIPRSTLEAVVAPLGRFAQEVVHRIFIVGRSRNIVPGVHAVNIGQEDVAGGAGNPHLILQVQGQLEIARASCARPRRCPAGPGRAKKMRRPWKSE